MVTIDCTCPGLLLRCKSGDDDSRYLLDGVARIVKSTYFRYILERWLLPHGFCTHHCLTVASQSACITGYMPAGAYEFLRPITISFLQFL